MSVSPAGSVENCIAPPRRRRPVRGSLRWSEIDRETECQTENGDAVSEAVCARVCVCARARVREREDQTDR